MGQLVDGVWHDTWYDTKSTGGAFKRTAAQFRNWITADGSAGPSGEAGFKAESGRYHLYVSYAVVDPQQGDAPQLRHRPGHYRHAGQGRPHAGALGEGHGVNVLGGDPGLLEGLPQHRQHLLLEKAIRKSLLKKAIRKRLRTYCRWCLAVSRGRKPWPGGVM